MGRIVFGSNTTIDSEDATAGGCQWLALLVIVSPLKGDLSNVLFYFYAARLDGLEVRHYFLHFRPFI